MIFNTDMSIALKNFYGQYDLKNFSLFEINKINESFTSLKVKIQNNEEIILKIKCPLCGNYHQYKYSVNEFARRKIIIGGCEVLGLPLFYIGNHYKVKQKISRIDGINKEVCAMI